MNHMQVTQRNNPTPKPRKVLIIGAMDTELKPLLASIGQTTDSKLIDIFPLHQATVNGVELYIVKTYVGDVNASIAGYEAIRTIDPDLVIKFGAVGGSYPESKAGDIIVPLGFFHRTSWITRNKKTGHPTNNAALWQSVFGELPFQVNSDNLGGMPYSFPVSDELQAACKKSLKQLNLKFVTAFIGGGNMWMFSQPVLKNVAETMLPKNTGHKRFVSDMESYALTHACYLKQKPFIGCYVVVSNDYLDEEYNPVLVSSQMSRLVPYVLDLASQLVVGG